ncbi:hypothetical protein AgCh_008691 [Apium graveolens]
MSFKEKYLVRLDTGSRLCHLKVLDDKLPEVLDFSKDLDSLTSLAKIQVKILAEELQAICKGLEKVVQELSLSESDGPVSEKFQKGRNIDASILYFGEDAARCTFEQGHEENCKQQELDKKKAEKEATSKQTKTNISHKGAETSIVK